MHLMVIACFLSVLAIVIRGTLPRYRVDQALTLHWKLIAILLLLFYLEVVLSAYYFSL
jgi:NADH:ubiquinone oxidoreductase subunit H